MILELNVVKLCHSIYYHLYSISCVWWYLSQQCARQLFMPQQVCWRISQTPCYIAYNVFRMPAPEWYFGGASTSMSCQCSGSFTGCPSKAASCTTYCYLHNVFAWSGTWVPAWLAQLLRTSTKTLACWQLQVAPSLTRGAALHWRRCIFIIMLLQPSGIHIHCESAHAPALRILKYQ